MINQIKADIKKQANPKKAKIYQRFFKTEKGEYGEGDIFIGLTGLEIKKIAKKYSNLSAKSVNKLLNSKIHEERSIALSILIMQYNESNEEKKEKIFKYYLKNTKNINNWDLVDISAYKIIGNFLLNNKKNKSILYHLAKSDNLWEKRISIISTFAFIKDNQFKDSLKISEVLLKDKHDLIHKAVGWMLREIGKKDLKTEEKFLKKHYRKMPRTMLRYAIEKFPEKKRQKYLKGKIK